MDVCICICIHKQLALPRSPLNTQKKPFLIVPEVNLVFLVFVLLHVVVVVVAFANFLVLLKKWQFIVGLYAFHSFQRNLAAALEMVWNLEYFLTSRRSSLD